MITANWDGDYFCHDDNDKGDTILVSRDHDHTQFTIVVIDNNSENLKTK